MKEINFLVAALPGDTVHLKALDCKATVIAVYRSRTATTYEIAWFAAGQRYSAFLQPEEFSEQPEKPPISSVLNAK